MAGKWLRNTKGCDVVFEDLRGATKEIPDAIGFKQAFTILIECKANYNDFKQDKKKPFRRRPGLGMGNFRYYMCPKDLIKLEEIPKKWGLLYVTENGRVQIIKEVMKPNILKRNKNLYEVNKKNEYKLLLYGFKSFKEGKIKKNKI